MVNFIWFALLAIGIVYGIINGTIDAVTASIFTSAGQTLNIVLEMTATIALWMGLLKIAEKAGLVSFVARVFTPFVRKLFPDIPDGHPSIGSMVMNISANFLGLGSAATPFGLKAMAELQELNPQPDKASYPMLTFLIMNTSSLTLIPAMVISLRATGGAENPTDIIGAVFLASSIALCIGLMIDFMLRFWHRRRGL